MGNVYQFGVKDEAASRQEIVDTLKRLIEEHDELKIFPSNFKLALEERVWEKERKSSSGKTIPPVSLHDFIHERYPIGIGATYDLVERLIGGRPDVLALWVEVTKRKAGEDQPRDPDTGRMLPNVDNVNERPERPTGNSAAAGLRKLQKAANEGNEKAAEELEAVKSAAKSINAACIDAGLRKKATPLETMMRAWRKASDEERAQFRDWIDTPVFERGAE